MRIERVLACLVVLLFTATSAMAAGFRLPEAGAKAMAMGFAFSAQADDPSAIYFNPAGITQLEGNNVMVGGTLSIVNGATFSGITPLTGGTSVSETQKDLYFFIPNAFYTRKASQNFAYGIGLFVPFGLGQEYEDHHATIFRNQISEINLETYVINPTVAWKINDVLSVGAGIDFLYGSAKLHKTGVAFAGPLAGQNLFDAHLTGDGTAWGYNFGVQLTPSKSVKVGFNYRSRFQLDIKDGNFNLTDYNPAVAGNPAFPQSSKGSVTLNLPATADLGVAYIGERFTVEVDAAWTFWSSYNQLVILNDTSPALNSTSPKNWRDKTAIYIGGEYRVTDPLALRLGFRYDPTPVPGETMGPELPDTDKFYYSAGAGYKYRNWTFDLAYMYVDKKDRTASNIRVEGTNVVGFDGNWTGDGHLVGFDVGYKF